MKCQILKIINVKYEILKNKKQEKLHPTHFVLVLPTLSQYKDSIKTLFVCLVTTTRRASIYSKNSRFLTF